jgi:hypothetical protein
MNRSHLSEPFLSQRHSLCQFRVPNNSFIRRQFWSRIAAAVAICMTSLLVATAQEPGRANSGKQRQTSDRDKLLGEHQRLFDEEIQLASEQEYAEVIMVSKQRELVVLELARFPDQKADVNATRLSLLGSRASWQSAKGLIADAIQTSELRLKKYAEKEFGAKQSMTAFVLCTI